MPTKLPSTSISAALGFDVMDSLAVYAVDAVDAGAGVDAGDAVGADGAVEAGDAAGADDVADADGWGAVAVNGLTGVVAFTSA